MQKYSLKIKNIFNFLNVFFILALLFLLLPNVVLSQNYIGEWYIKDFHSEIVVNIDSSLTITEKITADCPQCNDKHGIFRTLAIYHTTDSKQKIKLPIKLESITDFNNNPHSYETIKNNFDKTVTWKIGDSNKTVSGENYYQIKYMVKNAVRSLDQNRDELYWNLSGNQWDIPIEKFYAKVIFPEQIKKENSELNIYSGAYGRRANTLAKSNWESNVLNVESTQTLNPGDGITASVVFPAGVIKLYQPSWLDKYGGYLWILLPVIVFAVCFDIWKKYGVDPKIKAGRVPEFGPPDNLSPLYLSLIQTGGALDKNGITAEIINLAVAGALKINEVKGGTIFSKKDYELELQNDKKTVNGGQRVLLQRLFSGNNYVKLSNLKNSFYLDAEIIRDQVADELRRNKLLAEKISWLIVVPISLCIIGVTAMFLVLFLSGSIFGFFALLASAVISLVFAILMPRRTRENEQMLFKIRGFKYYMTVAEKYRQKFNEKENIFERFLSYAILFGITDLWIKKMREIYGAQYVSSYMPIWYAESSPGNFNFDSFSQSLSSVSSAVSSAASAPSSSGSGGGGSSGGGGGGGGGGGW